MVPSPLTMFGKFRGQEYIQAVARTLVSATGLAASVRDEFFSQRLYQGIRSVLLAAFRFQGAREDNVAQYKNARDKLLRSLRSFSETLDVVDYMQLAAAVPLRQALRAVMELRLATLRRQNPSGSSKPADAVSLGNTSRPAPTPRTVPVTDQVNGVALTSNQQRILDFIREHATARAKDIVTEFGVLSKRTVKRNLKELMDSGLIQKHSEDRAVFYLPVASMPQR